MKHRGRIHADPADSDDDEQSFNIVDQFDRLPDCILLLIFNKLADVKSLGRCSAVSKRFNSIALLVNDVHVKIDHVLNADGANDEAVNRSSDKAGNLFSYYFRLMLFNILRPFNGDAKPSSPQVSQHSPAHILRKFKEIRSLKIELPAGDVATDDGVLLRWRAEFGSTLQSCVILGGMRSSGGRAERSTDDNGGMPESFFTNGGLKLRVVWTISSLIAASTRHFLLRDIIKDHPTLRRVEFTDAEGQGTLFMGSEQLTEFRDNPCPTSQSVNRTQVPASKMKLRYSPYLEMGDGVCMERATMVEIRPAGDCDSSGDNGKKTVEVFDEPFCSAVRAFAKQRTYLLEMNGF